MILSDRTIKEYITAGKINILPAFNPSDLRPTGIRLHLASDLLIPAPFQTVDLASAGELHFEHCSTPYTMKPGEFLLASTVERIQVPRNIICHLDGRSTIARLGLSVHSTSHTIDGNYESPQTIVLELINNGPFNIILQANTPIAQLSFSFLSSDIEQSPQRQYAGQQATTPPNLYSLLK